MKDKPPFKTFDHGDKNFNSIKKTFGLDGPLPAVLINFYINN
jgi:hypothetical protein